MKKPNYGKGGDADIKKPIYGKVDEINNENDLENKNYSKYIERETPKVQLLKLMFLEIRLYWENISFKYNSSNL